MAKKTSPHNSRITVPCPRCGKGLTGEDIKTLRASYNGRKGGGMRSQRALQLARRDANGLTKHQRDTIAAIRKRDIVLAGEIARHWREGLAYQVGDDRPATLRGIFLWRGNKQAETWRKYHECKLPDKA